MDRADPAYAGQRDYNRAPLNLYDPLVLGPIAGTAGAARRPG